MTINQSKYSKPHRDMLAVVAALVLLVTLSLSFHLAGMPSCSSVLPSSEIIQPSSASRTETEVANDCSNLFLYIPMGFDGSGLSSKLQNYVLALHAAASFHRTLVVINPYGKEAELTSTLGCSPGANNVNQNVDLLDLLDIPSSDACAQALCVKTLSEWKEILVTSDKKSEIPTVTCHKVGQATPTSVMISGGFPLRRIYQNVAFTNQLDFSQWVTRLGSMPQQLEFFKNSSNTIEELWMGVAGLLAPKIQWKPSIRQQVAERIAEMRLPPNFTAFHVRRGDKLLDEAIRMVKEYWETRGENPNNLNYLPLEAYVAKLNALSDPQDIYIATDDPATVMYEIEQLKAAGTYWKFHFLSDHHHSHSGHMLHERNCTVAYDMTIDAAVDLEVLTRADVFVGELNSNWGRIVQTMRSNFTKTYPSVRDFRFAFTAAKLRFLGD